MSYSRWSYSKWYAFWNADSGNNKNEQILSLWFSRGEVINWTYEELLEMTVSDIQRIYGCNLQDAEEAMLYVRQFIDQVNGEYNDN